MNFNEGVDKWMLKHKAPNSDLTYMVRANETSQTEQLEPGQRCKALVGVGMQNSQAQT